MSDYDYLLLRAHHDGSLWLADYTNSPQLDQAVADGMLTGGTYAKLTDKGETKAQELAMPTREQLMDLLHGREEFWDTELEKDYSELSEGILKAVKDRNAKWKEIKQILSLIDSSKDVRDIITILQERQQVHITRDEDGKVATFFEAKPEYTEIAWLLGRITAHKTGGRRIDDE